MQDYSLRRDGHFWRHYSGCSQNPEWKARNLHFHELLGELVQIRRPEIILRFEQRKILKPGLCLVSNTIPSKVEEASYLYASNKLCVPSFSICIGLEFLVSAILVLDGYFLLNSSFLSLSLSSYILPLIARKTRMCLQSLA